MQIVQNQRISELDVLYGLLEGEPIGVEGYEAVAYRPVLNWLTEDGVVGEHDKIDDRLLSQASENVLHRLSHCLNVGEGGERGGGGEERGGEGGRERGREREMRSLELC